MGSWFGTLADIDVDDDSARPQLPFGIALFRAFVAVFIAAVPLEYTRTLLPWFWAAAVMAGVVAAASWRAGAGAAAGAAGMGWLMLNAFVVHSNGVLGWDGHRDVLRLAALLAAGLSASGARALLCWARRAPGEAVPLAPTPARPNRPRDRDLA